MKIPSHLDPKQVVWPAMIECQIEMANKRRELAKKSRSTKLALAVRAALRAAMIGRIV